MKKTFLNLICFCICVSSVFSQAWLDSFKNVKSRLPDSVREKVDEAFENKNVVKSVDDTIVSMNKAMEEITPEEEYYIGRAVAAKILAKYPVYDSPDAQKYLNKILHSLTVFSDRPNLFKDYFVVILDSDELNAFATSGGHIMITKGLINCADSEDSLAAVLAHEVGHVLLKHSANAIKTSRLGNALAKGGESTFIAINGEDSDYAALASEVSAEIDASVNELLEKGYSKQQELSADTKALELLYGAGYDVHAMDTMLNALAKNSSSSDSLGFGKTHPSPSTRLKNVQIRYRFYPSQNTSNKNVQREKRFVEFKKYLQ